MDGPVCYLEYENVQYTIYLQDFKLLALSIIAIPCNIDFDKIIVRKTKSGEPCEEFKTTLTQIIKAGDGAVIYYINDKLYSIFEKPYLRHAIDLTCIDPADIVTKYNITIIQLPDIFIYEPAVIAKLYKAYKAEKKQKQREKLLDYYKTKTNLIKY